MNKIPMQHSEFCSNILCLPSFICMNIDSSGTAILLHGFRELWNTKQLEVGELCWSNHFSIAFLTGN